jgi:hypothetical protein
MAYLGELYSGLGAEVRKKTALLAAYGEDLPHRAAVVRLTRYAGLILAAHQHEHGLPGQPVRGLARWELARTALVPLYVADFLVDERFGFSVYDINGDGVQEAVYFDGTYLYAFSPRGGRLLYWYDAAAGVELAGCPFPAHSDEEFPDDSVLVADRAGAHALWPWLKHPERLAHADRAYPLRRRALSGHFTVKRGQETTVFSDADAESQYLLKLPCIEFSIHHKGLILQKTVKFARDGFSVEYRLSDEKGAALAVDLVVDNAFSPDCHDLLLGGPGTAKASAGRIEAPGGLITVEPGETGKLACEREVFAWNQRVHAKGRGTAFAYGFRVRRTLPGKKTVGD